MQEVKQVIVVRKDLNMRKGKLASQVAHASMKVLLDRMFIKYYNWDRGDDTPHGSEEWILDIDRDTPMWEWLNGSFTKVVLYVEFEDAIHALANRCHFMGIPHAIITDAGRTEFHGVPTVTCIAIGPWWSNEIDEITGGLPLL